MLITGASGFIGSALCRAMERKGHRTIRAGRHGQGAGVNVGDVNASTDWRMALVGCEAVVHLAARVHVMRESVRDPLAEFRKVNVEGTLNLAWQSAAAGVGRFVYLSSVKVNGEGTAASFGSRSFIPTRSHGGEEKASEEGGAYIEEDVPAPEDAYAVSKHEAEQGLMAIARETGMEVVIIRPPLVYGPGVKGNFASMVHCVQKGVPLPLGAVHNHRSLVALDNLVDFIALCANREKSLCAANQVFLISDGEDVSTTELLRRVARAYGVQARLIPVPVSWMRFAAGLLGKAAVADRLFGSLMVDSSKARNLLGWRPVVSMDEQLRKMAFDDAHV